MSDIKKQGDSDPALARLLAEALRPAGGAASDETCPDAGLLAAYADHNLDAAESAHWEEHFAGCARCQKILAVLTVSSEEPLGEAEVERFGRLAAAAGSAATGVGPHSAEVKKVVPFARPRTAWRWMAPAAGIAAAVALWIALRPAPPHGTSAFTAQKTTAQPSAAPGDSLEAKADVPAPPAAASSREVAPSPAGRQQLESPTLAQPQAKKNDQAANAQQIPQQSAAQADSVAAAPQPEGGLQGTVAPAPAQNSPGLAATEESPAAVSAAASATGAPRAAPNAGAAGGADATAAKAAAPAPAPASGAEAKSAENRTVQTFAARGIAGGIGAGLAGRAPVVLASPNRSVLWRLGPGGRIERSSDQGRTWRVQASGVTSDLLVGAAPSDTVVWIAGRAGVILRTTDGEHWQRVPSPDAAADWTSIEASDALHATIVSSDRRRFATEDGGQTWK
jgi:hypothetical protein